MIRAGLVSVLLLSLLTIRVNCDHGEEGHGEETTCEVLRKIASSSTANCTTNGEKDCDTIICKTTFFNIPIDYNATVLSCEKPPAIGVRVVGGGQVALDKTFTESENVTILGGVATIEVTVDQLDEALGVELEALTPVNDVFLDYTEIPVECKDVGLKGGVFTVALLSVAMMLVKLF